MKYRMTEISHHGVVTEWSDGKVTWNKEPRKATTQFSGPKPREKQREDACYSAIEIRSQFNTLRYGGQREVRGGKYDVLIARNEDGVEVTTYLDAKTRLNVLTDIPVPNLRLRIKLSDYRAVDGIKLPFSSVIS